VGSLVLGGVDTKKFSGTLTKVPVVDAPPGAEDYQLSQYWMTVDGATLDNGTGGRTTISGFKVAPASTSPFSYLPSDIVVAEAFGVGNWTDPEWAVVPCSRADGVKGSLELDFAGFTASIPYSEFIQPLEGTNPKGDCLINVQQMEFGGPFPVWYLGNTFLRSVYAVFDQENMAVWMAKSADCGSEPVAFKGSDVKGQCEGSPIGGASSNTQGGSSGNDGGSAGSRLGAGTVLMVGAALTTLII
jgi:aspartyl protease